MQDAAFFDFWRFLAGMGLFIFAMNLVEHSLSGVSTHSVQKFFQRQSRHPFRIVAASILITALLQSSSILLMLVLTYCSAGILPVSAALLATLGANIGTTLDTWLIVLLGFEVHLDAIIYPILGCSSLLVAISPAKSKISDMASALMGLSFLLLSLEWLKFSLNLDAAALPTWITKGHYLLFIPAGIILTAIIQSSLATAAIALSAIYHGVFAFDQAAALVIGAETGTTLKFVLASANSSISRKKVAFGNFYINVLTTLLAIIFLPTAIWLLKEKIGLKNDLYALAAVQTSFNLISMVLFIPFLPQTEKFLNRQFGRNSSATAQFLNSYRKDISNPLHPAFLEVLHLFHHVISWNRLILQLNQHKEEKKWRALFIPQRFDHFYKEIKMLEGEILEYLSKTDYNDALSRLPDQRKQLINSCRYLGRSAKCLKDIQHNLSEFETSLNDAIHDMIGRIRKHCGEILQHAENNRKEFEQEDAGENLLYVNKKFYETFNEQLVWLLGQGKITEIDMASLLNLNREVYESNKAIIKANIELTQYSNYFN